MAKRIPDRLNWAVQVLAVDPADRLLEIGCGTGVAVSLICQKLVSGKIFAVDQSEAMIKKATSANLQHIASGRAAFQTVSLAEAEFGNERFNKIFAVNVNVFWQQPTRELEIIESLLNGQGILYLFYEPPLVSKAGEIVNKLTRVLPDNGFTVIDVLSKDLKPVPVVCVIAEASR